MRIGGTQPLCEACPKSPSGWLRRADIIVGYKDRMLCPDCALDAIHADGLTLDQAMGCADE